MLTQGVTSSGIYFQNITLCGKWTGEKQSEWKDQSTVVLITNCDSMDGTGEYYAKWNKPVGERQIPYDLTYKRNLINKRN